MHAATAAPKKGKRTDVAHAPDQLRSNEGAEKKTQEIGRTNQAKCLILKAFKAAAQGDDRVEQS
jgi:hypothetical protein